MSCDHGQITPHHLLLGDGAMNTQATIGELLEAVFSVGSILCQGAKECPLLEDVTQQCSEDHE
jgi:hypothetical protein